MEDNIFKPLFMFDIEKKHEYLDLLCKDSAWHLAA